MQMSTTSPLYPPIEPYRTETLDTGDGHQVYWECCGNPDAPSVIFLHGGPGAGCATSHRRLFDPEHWNIVLFDQRGCGRSRPTAGTENNTTDHLIADMETIREAAGIDNWMVFGGSWGSTLALAYGIRHPDRCRGFILRGIFLGTMAEVEWFMNDMGRFFPGTTEKFASYLPENERGNLLAGYHTRLMSDDPAVHQPAANVWSSYESSCARLRPVRGSDAGGSLPLARLEAHYFVNRLFMPDGHIMQNIDRITHLPAVIVQGRYDVICPPFTAQRLADAWPGADLRIIDDAGHSAFEPPILQALMDAARHFPP